MDNLRISFWGVSFRTMVVHTITYFVAGVMAMLIMDYRTSFAEPPYSLFMRQIDDPLVTAGVLFQPLRGLLFGVAFYLLRDVFFREPRGWLTMWIVLVMLGILSTFGPAPGSLEGLVYMTLPIAGQLIGLWEVLLQSLLLSVVLCYWVRQPEKRWLGWSLGISTLLILAMSALGTVVQLAGLGG